jgi:hypothetical protein
MRKYAVVIAIVTVLSVLAALPAAAGDVPVCGGSLPTLLVVGGRGQIAQSFSTLYDTPAGNPIQIVEAPAQFTVIAGPVSDGWLCYFYIQYDSGLAGWAIESQVASEWGDNMYWLMPVATPVPVNPLCPGGMVNMLSIGVRGYVVSTYSTLRDSPGGAPVQRVYSPAQFTVIGGPATDGYLCYYQLLYDDGATGWASESQLVSPWGSNRYWLAPITS